MSARSRQVILDGVRQMAASVAVAAALPPELAPTVKVLDEESATVTYNDPAMTAKVRASLIATLGKENVSEGRSGVPRCRDGLRPWMPRCYP